MEREHDQAMSAYFNAARLLNGSHMPYFFIGKEYMRSESFQLAEQHFKAALSISPGAPQVLVELALLYITRSGGNAKLYEHALKYLLEAEKSFKLSLEVDAELSECDSQSDIASLAGIGSYVTPKTRSPLGLHGSIEAVYFQMGICLLQLEQMDEAKMAFKTARQFNTTNWETAAYVAMINAYQSKYDEAMIWIDRARSLGPDDEVALELYLTIKDFIRLQKEEAEGEDQPNVDEDGSVESNEDVVKYKKKITKLKRQMLDLLPKAPQIGALGNLDATEKGTPNPSQSSQESSTNSAVNSPESSEALDELDSEEEEEANISNDSIDESDDQTPSSSQDIPESLASSTVANNTAANANQTINTTASASDVSAELSFSDI